MKCLTITHQIIKVVKRSESLRNYHSQEELKQTYDQT